MLYSLPFYPAIKLIQIILPFLKLFRITMMIFIKKKSNKIWTLFLIRPINLDPDTEFENKVFTTHLRSFIFYLLVPCTSKNLARNTALI